MNNKQQKARKKKIKKAIKKAKKESANDLASLKKVFKILSEDPEYRGKIKERIQELEEEQKSLMELTAYYKDQRAISNAWKGHFSLMCSRIEELLEDILYQLSCGLVSYKTAGQAQGFLKNLIKNYDKLTEDFAMSLSVGPLLIDDLIIQELKRFIKIRNEILHSSAQIDPHNVISKEVENDLNISWQILNESYYSKIAIKEMGVSKPDQALNNKTIKEFLWVQRVSLSAHCLIITLELQLSASKVSSQIVKSSRYEVNEKDIK